MESRTNAAIMYILVQLPKEQLSLVVTQCLFHASTTSDHAQLRPEDAIILQFLHCNGDVTSWNIRLYCVHRKLDIAGTAIEMQPLCFQSIKRSCTDFSNPKHSLRSE